MPRKLPEPTAYLLHLARAYLAADEHSADEEQLEKLLNTASRREGYTGCVVIDRVLQAEEKERAEAEARDVNDRG